jgi:hypothetical protein
MSSSACVSHIFLKINWHAQYIEKQYWLAPPAHVKASQRLGIDELCNLRNALGHHIAYIHSFEFSFIYRL